MGIKILLIMFAVLIVALISGCTPAPPELETPIANLKISETVDYGFSIKNPSQIGVKKEFSDFNLKFIPSEKFFIDNSQIVFDKSSIKDRENARVTVPIVSLFVGEFLIEGDLVYTLDYEEEKQTKTVPFKINSNTPHLGNEKQVVLKLKEGNILKINPKTDFGKPRTLHLEIKKEKDNKYSQGKIIIKSELYSKLSCVTGYECVNEGDNQIEIFIDISKNLEVPFDLTVNKPGPQTDEVSFTSTIELWYKPDNSSNWGKITENSFSVKTN